MPTEKNTKITFYAEPDISKWLDSLDAGQKSKTINNLLRDGMQQKHGLDEQLALIQGRLKRLEQDSRFDGFSIAALRRIMLNRFGPSSADEFKKEYDDFYYGSRNPPRTTT